MSHSKDRAANLSYSEIVLLVDLCLKYRDMTENKKKTDTPFRHKGKKKGGSCLRKNFTQSPSAEQYERTAAAKERA